MNDVTIFTHEETEEPALLARARAFLDASECARADRFVFPADRALFTIAHALIRHAIGPGAFETVGNGRPELVDRRLRFNLSHTRGMAVVAVTSHADIGVDVEDTQRMSDGASIADSYFSPSEVRALKALPLHRQQDGFFRYWTLKEAYIKARGLGLALPLDGFSFSFDPLRIAFTSIDDQPARWAFWQDTLGPRHMLSLCVTAPLGRVERVDVRL